MFGYKDKPPWSHKPQTHELRTTINNFTHKTQTNYQMNNEIGFSVTETVSIRRERTIHISRLSMQEVTSGIANATKLLDETPSLQPQYTPSIKKRLRDKLPTFLSRALVGFFGAWVGTETQELLSQLWQD